MLLPMFCCLSFLQCFYPMFSFSFMFAMCLANVFVFLHFCHAFTPCILNSFGYRGWSRKVLVTTETNKWDGVKTPCLAIVPLKLLSCFSLSFYQRLHQIFFTVHMFFEGAITPTNHLNAKTCWFCFRSVIVWDACARLAKYEADSKAIDIYCFPSSFFMVRIMRILCHDAKAKGTSKSQPWGAKFLQATDCPHIILQ